MLVQINDYCALLVQMMIFNEYNKLYNRAICTDRVVRWIKSMKCHQHYSRGYRRSRLKLKPLHRNEQRIMRCTTHNRLKNIYIGPLFLGHIIVWKMPTMVPCSVGSQLLLKLTLQIEGTLTRPIPIRRSQSGHRGIGGQKFLRRGLTIESRWCDDVRSKITTA